MTNKDSKGRFVKGNNAAKGNGARRFTTTLQAFFKENETVSEAAKRLHDIIINPETSTKDALQAINILFNTVIIPVSKDVELDIAEAQSIDVEALVSDVRKALNGELV
ncbi:hypothetical protein ACU6ZT_16315 [Klebsiella aerogenes]|uniref:hypothetical protein n=1 Tax=Klebsiella aerogenes TaxID=548 RepID=UPI003A4E1475